MESEYITMQSPSDTYVSNTHHQSNEEIELLGILILLWKEKILIFVTLLCFLVPVLLWLIIKPSVYSIEMQIDNTSSYSIESLEPSTLIGGGRYQVEKPDKNSLFQKIVTQLETLHMQQLFWEDWTKQPLTQDPQKTKTENDITFIEFSKNLKLIKPDPKKNDSTVNKITLSTQDPVTGIKLLSAYAEFLNREIANTAISQMEEGYTSNLTQLKADYVRLTNREQERLSDRLIHLTEQLKLAHSLKIIDTPYEKLAGIELKVVDNRLYLLGSKALTEEIKALETRQEKQPSIYVSDLRNMEHWQKAMEDDIEKLYDLKEKIRVFEVTSPPVSSIESVNPNKLLVILGTLLLSILIGSIIALLKQGIQSHKERFTNASY